MTTEDRSPYHDPREPGVPPHPSAVPIGQKLFDVVGGFALRRVHVSAARGWTGVPDVLSHAELAEFAAQRRAVEEAETSAHAVLARAKAEADALLERAKQHARSLGDSQLKLWQEAFDVRQEEVNHLLGDAVSVVVESVLRHLLGTHAELPVKASIELAMRTLGSELRAAAACHPLDLPEVESQGARLGIATVRAREGVPRGQIVFHGPEGEVSVDGMRMIDRLAEDLRSVFTTRQPVPPAP